MNQLISLFLVLFALPSFAARLTDGKIQFKLVNQKIEGAVTKGFHVNREAPAALESADGKISRQPEVKETQRIVFATDSVGNQDFSLNFYLCDDANTVCESHEMNYQIVNQKLVAARTASAASQTAATVAAKPNVALKKNGHGFIEERFDEALALAKKENKKLLVDFRAPWCPACIRLESEVLDHASFKTATKSVIKVSINIDLMSNKALADRYSVKAIPTLLILDSSGEELYRNLDYKPVAPLVAELSQALKQNDRSYANLRKAAEAGDSQAKVELGKREFRALNYKEASFWLKGSSEGLLLATSEVQAASQEAEKDPAANKSYQDILEKNFNLFPETFEAITWRNDWAENQSKNEKTLAVKTKEVLNKNIEQIDKLIPSADLTEKIFAQNNIGDFSRFETAELIAQKMKSVELLSAENAGSSLATTLEGLKKQLRDRVGQVSLSVKRPGELISALYYLNLAGEKSQVVEWYDKLIKANPKSYVYYRRMANFYLADKEYAKALPFAEKTVELGQETPLQHHLLLAKVQKGLQRSADAQSTLNKALALPEAKIERNKKVVQSLEDFKKTL